MKGFLFGFVLASLLWGAAGLVYFSGVLDPPAEEEVAVAEIDAGIAVASEAQQKRGRRAKRRRRGKRRGGKKSWQAKNRGQQGEMETGDDLDDVDPRELDLGGDVREEQLSSAQIDSSMGRAMPGVRRCLLHLPPDSQAGGRVVFGIRIKSTGRTGAVRLSGPSPLVSGKVGKCLRRTVRAVSFPGFDGPDMVVSYPITFE